MTPTAPPPLRFVLWHRRGSRQRWRAVFGAATEAECTQHITSAAESGDWLTLPADRDPNARAK